ncbi:pentatricopeptide repeat-containing protein At3g29290 [Amaranthus tricolor]|uniref:pentatricopeptide repeat-containing protein At3g29290 n=1 Tax=Amaranthus tricolor TaxID=29722 RepID=UPI002584F558|nr:pentatricopeptide repeat-containing protein At3g29290 [Amaranthus tricolor]
MADVFMKSPTKFLLFNEFSHFSSPHNHGRIECYTCMSSASSKFRAICTPSKISIINVNFQSSCGVCMFNERKKCENSVNLKIRVSSVEHELGETPFMEDEADVKQLSGTKLDFGTASANHPLKLSNRGELKLYYLEERNEGLLSKRIVGLSRANKHISALQLFNSMIFSGLRPELLACNSLLACLSRKNLLNDLLRVFTTMSRDKIISAHSCSLVLKTVAKHCGRKEALQMFDEWEVVSEMKEHFDVILYNTAITICGKENKWIEMERVWKTMKENGIVGTTITYRLLVCSFVRCGQYEKAIDAYVEMLQNGIEPECDAMHAIIGAYLKEEKWDLSLDVFYSMLDRGMKPNLIACNALINSLGKASKLRAAFKVYKHIRDLGHTPDSYTWNALLAALYRANQYADALQFFDSIQKEWSFEPTLQLYNTALMCCQRLGFWDKALQLLWKMESSGILVSTASYNVVIGACEVARKPKIALQVYAHMLDQNCVPDTFTHLSLIRSCIWGDLWDEVTHIFDESTPNVSLYNAAIHGMCLRGRIELAKRLYMRMRDIGLAPDGKTRALMLQFMQQDSTRGCAKSRE